MSRQRSLATFSRLLLLKARHNPILAASWVGLFLLLSFLLYVFLFQTSVPWLPFQPYVRVETSEGGNAVGIPKSVVDREKAKKVTWAYEYRYGPRHIGVAPPDATYYAPEYDRGEEVGLKSVTEPGGYRFVWKTDKLNFDTYGASKSSPAVDADHVYIGTDRTTIVALDRRDGSIVWQKECSPSHPKGIHGTPALDGKGRIYVGTYAGRICAFNTADGSSAWTSRVGDFIGASMTVYNGGIYTGVEMRGPAGHLVGVEMADGKEIFRSNRLPDYCHSTPSIDPETGLAFMGDNSGAVSGWNVSRGAPSKEVLPMWRVDLFKGGDVKSTPAIYKNFVFATSWDNNLHAFDKFNGVTIWRFQMGGASMSSPSVDPTRQLVIVASSDGYVYAVELMKGKLKWKFRTGASVISSATLLVHENIGIIGSGDSHVYVFSLDDGQVLQKLKLQSKLTGVPVVYGRHLYVFDHLGYMYSWVAIKERQG